MGLFLFMTPDGGKYTGFGESLDKKAYEVHFTATVNSKQVAAATATRQLPAGLGVTSRRLSVARDGVTGVLYRPKDTSTRKPALLVFGGSEGGLNYVVTLEAAMLAAHGYPTLALAYFRATRLPAQAGRHPTGVLPQGSGDSPRSSRLWTPATCSCPAHHTAGRRACWSQPPIRTW